MIEYKKNREGEFEKMSTTTFYFEKFEKRDFADSSLIREYPRVTEITVDNKTGELSQKTYTHKTGHRYEKSE